MTGLLLATGADVNLTDGTGATCLHYAASKGEPEVGGAGEGGCFVGAWIEEGGGWEGLF